MKQKTLPLISKTTRNESDWITSKENKEPFLWATSWPKNLENQNIVRAVCFYGLSGCGKTHLAHIWKACHPQALFLEGGRENQHPLTLQFQHGCVIDNADKIFDEFWLFQCINRCLEQKGFLLVTSAAPPAMWSIKLPDLRSRLNAFHAIEIKHASDETLRAIYHKQFKDKGFLISEQVAAYLVKYMERDLKSVRSFTQYISHQAIKEKSPITIPFVKRLFSVFDVSGEFSSKNEVV